VAVMRRFEVVVKVSSAPIGTEHLPCFIPSEFANFSVMKCMLEPVSSRTLPRIGCALSFKMLIFAVTNRSRCSTADGDVIGDSVPFEVIVIYNHFFRSR
jgi:hypothetical protein